MDGARGPVSAADWARERDDGALGPTATFWRGALQSRRVLDRGPGGLRPQMRRILCARSTSFLGEVRTSALDSSCDSVAASAASRRHSGLVPSNTSWAVLPRAKGVLCKTSQLCEGVELYVCTVKGGHYQTLSWWQRHARTPYPSNEGQ